MEIIASNIQDIIDEIKAATPETIYSSFRNLFSILKPAFCKFTLTPGHKFLFRVRCHTEGNGEYFFNNLSDLTYRTDYLNIKRFGRCTQPFQSLFYCSDEEMLSFAEVSEIVRTENKKDTAYHTTSVWKMNEDLLVTSIFEPDNPDTENADLVDITKKCLEQIDLTKHPVEKDNLKLLLKLVANEFTKPFSTDNQTYLFSSAVANYFLDTISTENEKIDGLVYPTCLGKSGIRNLGLNYVFRSSIVDFDKKIEFHDAYRSKMEKKGFEYHQTQIVKFKKANKFTGEIFW